MGKSQLLLAAIVLGTAMCSSAGAQCEVAKLIAEQSLLADDLGAAVAMDADTLIVGDPTSSLGTTQGGAVHVYERGAPGAGWTREATLLAQSPGVDDRFGAALDIDGDVLVVGAPREENLGGSVAGAVYVFRRSTTGAWALAQRLQPPSVAFGHQFGSAVAVDAGRLVVGAPGDGTVCVGSGSAYVFESTVFGFAQIAQLLPNTASCFAAVGASVDVEGDRLVLGAPNQTQGSSANAGMAVVYENQGGWVEVCTLSHPSPSPNDRFGRTVAVSAGRIACGVPEDDSAGPNEGRVFVFTPSAGCFTLSASLVPAGIALIPDAYFGSSLALDGERLLAGAAQSGGIGAFLAVYLFELGGPQWMEVGRIAASDSALYVGEFGASVGIDGDAFAVGAPRDSEVALFDGATYVFEFNTTSCLIGHPGQISLSSGGVHSFTLDSGAGAAGDLYLIVGSASGTLPGVLVDGLLLPLNVDAYTTWTIVNANGQNLPNSGGVLGTQGAGVAALQVPAATNPALGGLTLWHSYVVLPSSPGRVSDVSNASSVILVP